VARRRDVGADGAGAAVPDLAERTAATLNRRHLQAGIVTAAVGLGLAALETYAVSGADPVLMVGSQGVIVAAPTDTARPPPAVSRGTARVGGVPEISPAWVAHTAGAAGVPVPAVRAYGVATLREQAANPGCHLAWTTLAGIGWVESQHGTLGGLSLGEDGRSSSRIDGPVLDGSGDVAAVPDDAGTWQRATGPLQFIPSTWERWGSDGDGDGVADPQDLDDAAYAAARYLCASGADLATGPGWSAAVFSYNHSDSYVRTVYDAAQAYADRTSG
jgi:membrane-bound lytic murein transglycosylase B